MGSSEDGSWLWRPAYIGQKRRRRTRRRSITTNVGIIRCRPTISGRDVGRELIRGRSGRKAGRWTRKRKGVCSRVAVRRAKCSSNKIRRRSRRRSITRDIRITWGSHNISGHSSGGGILEAGYSSSAHIHIGDT